MNDHVEKIKAVLSEFDANFISRPEMLGTPEEVNAIFFYLDKIRFIIDGEIDYDEFDRSWTGFLIKKKYIVGASNRLIEEIRGRKDGFEILRKVRDEYFEWRRQEAVRP